MEVHVVTLNVTTRLHPARISITGSGGRRQRIVQSQAVTGTVEAHCYTCNPVLWEWEARWWHPRSTSCLIINSNLSEQNNSELSRRFNIRYVGSAGGGRTRGCHLRLMSQLVLELVVNFLLPIGMWTSRLGCSLNDDETAWKWLPLILFNLILRANIKLEFCLYGYKIWHIYYPQGKFFRILSQNETQNANIIKRVKFIHKLSAYKCPLP